MSPITSARTAVFPKTVSLFFQCCTIALLASVAIFSSSCSSMQQGSLPLGLNLKPPANGQVPSTTTGTSTTTAQNLSISGSLKPATLGKSYKAALSVEGGSPPFGFSLAKGKLPAGLSLASVAGTISGVPKESGTFTFTVQVTSSQISASGQTQFTLTVTPLPSPGFLPLEISTSVLPKAEEGTSYHATLAAQGGLSPYIWSLAAGSLPANFTLDQTTGVISGSTTHTGSFAFTVKVSDKSSHSATQALSLDVATPAAVTPPVTGGFDGPAALPRASVPSSLSETPAPGKTIVVNAGGNLQQALNNASCGDTIRVQAGATFTGMFTLPAKNCDDNHWIIVRTSASDSSLPSEGTRLTPCYAGVSKLPARPAYPCPAPGKVLPTIVTPGNYAFHTANGANHYRLMGLEITHASTMPPGQPDTLVSLSSNPVPHHIVVDRCWIHGTAIAFLKRGVRMDGENLAVVDSTITDVHGVNTATQGILSGTGGGPLKISGNFVEGGDSAVGFGGQANPLGNPSDVEITRNHLFKPLTWRYGAAGYIGVLFPAKVALESKNSVRVLIQGNVMENTWGGPIQGGDGSIAWLGPKNQSNQCPTCQVTDVTVRYNIFHHAGAGLYIFDSPSDAGGIAVQAARFSIHDNLLDDINASYTGDAILNRFAGSTTFPPPRDILVAHNTGFSIGAGSGALILDTNTAAPVENFTFRDNLEGNGRYGILGCSGVYGLMVLEGCAQNYTFTTNGMIGGLIGASSSEFKLIDNFFLAAPSSAGFVNFNGGNGGDYRLCRGAGNPAPSCAGPSPYLNKASDGRDLGADIDAINSATAGVE